MYSLLQRPCGLSCGLAPRRRCWPPSVRPGTRISVIVPSKDNASGSSDQLASSVIPMLFDPSGRGALKRQRDQAKLEKSLQLGEAQEPDYAAVLGEEQELQGSEPTGNGVAVCISTGASTVNHDSTALNPAALQERIASSTQASTSDPVATAAGSSCHSANGASSVSYDGTGHSLQVHSGSRHSVNGAAPSSANSQSVLAINGVHAASSTGSDTPELHVKLAADGLYAVRHGSEGKQGSEELQHTQSGQAAAAAVSGAVSSSTSGAQQAAGTADASSTDIPRPIWILCCISAALTCASCVFNTALPIYMVSELKMSMRSMGMFEGLLEAFSYVVRMCSGVVSDRMTSRKAAITLGFAAGAMAKFGMASAGTVGLLFAGKAVDRLANGIQAAPRDALIGDLSPPAVRSSCFGLAQSLRKWGSAVGALAAFFLMKASNNNYQLIFYSAATVSLAACIAFVVFVPAHARVPQGQEQQGQGQQKGQAQQLGQGQQSAAAAQAGPLSGARELWSSVCSMGTDFYRMLGVICCYAMGHINESLLEARAMEVGFGKAEATLVVAALAAVTFLTAFPLGKLDDKYGPGTTFAVGISALIAGDLVLLLSGPHPAALFAACAFLGVHWAVIQGPLLSIVSGLAPDGARGTAFGIFYTVMALTAVAANTMYGSIWHTYGANAAFATSAGLMSLVLLALPRMLPEAARKRRGETGPAALVAGAPLPAAA